MSSNSDIKYSVLIPTLNAGKLWNDVLIAIDKQTLPIHSKIIVDSGSNDNTVELAKQHGFTVLTINKSEFDHGYARQLLAEAATESEILIYLTQDSVPANDYTFQNLIKGFENDKVGICYGRQLPRINARPLETHARLFNYPATSLLKTFDDKNKYGIKTASCSNSFAAYRRTALDNIGGFPYTSIFGEDVIVGGQMLKRGWKIAYIGNSEVYHSHDYTVIEELRRYFDIGVFHATNHWLLDDFGKADGEGVKYVKSELNFIFKNNIFLLPKMLFSTISKFVGYKLGLQYKKLPKKISKGLSMHKSYWDKH